MCLAIIDTGALTSELGRPDQTSVVPPNQWSLRSTETFPDDLGAQQRDSVSGSTILSIVYGYIYGEFIQCGSRVSYRMSRYFPHTFNVSYSILDIMKGLELAHLSVDSVAKLDLKLAQVWSEGFFFFNIAVQVAVYITIFMMVTLSVIFRS